MDHQNVNFGLVYISQWTDIMYCNSTPKLNHWRPTVVRNGLLWNSKSCRQSWYIMFLSMCVVYLIMTFTLPIIVIREFCCVIISLWLPLCYGCKSSELEVKCVAGWWEKGLQACWVFVFVTLDTTQRVRTITTRHFLNVVGQMTSCSEDVHKRHCVCLRTH